MSLFIVHLLLLIEVLLYHFGFLIALFTIVLVKLQSVVLREPYEALGSEAAEDHCDCGY
jgi:hypothetical protein